MGPDPVWDVRAPESFPGYSSTGQTSRFWGGNLFSKFLDLSSPSPAGRIGLDQCPLSAPPQPPSSGFSTELPGHCFPPQEVSDALRWILFSLLSGQLIFFPVRKKKKRGEREREIFPSRLQLSGRGEGGWRLSPPLTLPFCHAYRAEVLNEGGSPGPRACQAPWSRGQLWLGRIVRP